ncbi:hypothetical protein [Niabella soli]|uniref:SnoaL-like domain-containing protein n=1 Tax=Niabella soli DSM 19437 TaxID=929713 RepID=W0EY21_9BACT|nr:hypothetical protein [Niabella soli]AHF14104.1 hypothetical protein NIASO_00650 [Niabella soli DSM 19437]
MFQQQTTPLNNDCGKHVPAPPFNNRIFLSTVPFFLALALSIVFAGCTSKANEKEPDAKTIQADKDSIMATIEKESKSFFARDYDTWKSTYAQDDYAFQAWSNRDGTFDASVGWPDIDNTIGKYIHDNPQPQTNLAPIERKQIRFKFYGPDACFLTWDQFNSNKDSSYRHSKEVRVMEKKNGQWKIVCVAAFWDYNNLIPASQLKDIQKLDKESRGTDKI